MKGKHDPEDLVIDSGYPRNNEHCMEDDQDENKHCCYDLL